MSSNSSRIIEIRELAKAYRTHTGEEVLALGSVSCDIQEGEFITIVGPSGCGKSTLLKIIAGLLPGSGGSVRIRGTEVRGPTRQIGMIFQNPVLLPWKTVFENAMIPIEVLRLRPEDYVERARALIELVGLKGFEDSYPFELSGGMAQRNAIVRALVHNPEILLADEPFGALDAMTREQMNLEIQRIWLESRKTVLFVTHSIPEAVFLADTVVVLSQRPSQVVDLVRVEFPRPRSMEDMGTDRFGGYMKRIRSHFSGNAEESRPPAGAAL